MKRLLYILIESIMLTLFFSWVFVSCLDVMNGYIKKLEKEMKVELIRLYNTRR